MNEFKGRKIIRAPNIGYLCVMSYKEISLEILRIWRYLLVSMQQSLELVNAQDLIINCKAEQSQAAMLSTIFPRLCCAPPSIS